MSGPSEAGTPQPESGVPGDPSAPSDVSPVEATSDPASNHVDVGAALPEVSATTTDASVVTADGTPAATVEQPAPEAPTPPAKPADDLAARDLLLTQGARVLVLAALIGAAIGLWTQLAFRSPWL